MNDFIVFISPLYYIALIQMDKQAAIAITASLGALGAVIGYYGYKQNKEAVVTGAEKKAPVDLSDKCKLDSADFKQVVDLDKEKWSAYWAKEYSDPHTEMN